MKILNYICTTIKSKKQFNMNTLPRHWYIESTESNYSELATWRQTVATSYLKTFQVGNLLLSEHPDGSYYYGKDVNHLKNNSEFRHYQEITIEQFRQITKPMNTLPAKWYIQATEENHEELNSWRKRNATTYLGNGNFKVGHTLLSKHHRDKSYFYADDADSLRRRNEYKDYQEITIEQFRQITNSKPMSKTIQIPRTLLNEYYEAATKEQKEYIVNHFKMDGTTTDEAIRGLHEKACGDWKPKIKANHPDCFPEDSKYFDFSKYTNKCGHSDIVSESVADTLGLKRDFIMVRNSRNNDETHRRSFYLTPDYDWKLVQDGTEYGNPVMVLIPTKKVV